MQKEVPRRNFFDVLPPKMMCNKQWRNQLTLPVAMKHFFVLAARQERL
jgi:hypothetical protein